MATLRSNNAKMEVAIQSKDAVIDEIQNNLNKQIELTRNLQSGLQNADFITIHVPLTDGTKNLISKEELSLMNKNTIIVNTARGGIVNQDDLFQSLAENKILGAGLDVFTHEPPEKNDIILQAQNIVFTPHNAALTNECRKRMSIETIENILTHLDNKTDLDNIINKNIL